MLSGCMQHDKYPEPKRENIVDEFFGTKIYDPYRWMENLNDPDLKEWIKLQKKFTNVVLDTIPEKKIFKNLLKKLYSNERIGVPYVRGNKEFYFKNTGAQNQSILYVRENNIERILIDPNKKSINGIISINFININKDGSLLAYGQSNVGSDWTDIYILDVKTGEKFDEILKWTKFSEIQWSPKNDGFYYSKFPKPAYDKRYENKNNNQKLFFHKLNTLQEDDSLIYENTQNPNISAYTIITNDENYLILGLLNGTSKNNKIYYRLFNSTGEFIPLFIDFKANMHFIGNDDEIFYFKSDLNSPNNKLIAMDIKNPNPENWIEIIPEKEDVLINVRLVYNQFLVQYRKDVSDRLDIYSIDGQYNRSIGLPGKGSVSEIRSREDQRYLYYSFSSYLYPNKIYKYDLKTYQKSIWFEPEINFSPDDFIMEQIFYKSKDNIEIPMYLVYSKDMIKNSSNPTLMYGYGGFKISIMPSFSTSVIAWIKSGGIYAVPNIRGGNEYGENWHSAGMLHKKQNVFDDFISAAEYLIKNNYTKPKHLAISGRSNGGLLTLATAIQRPDLFGAVESSVPVADMLRYNKFTIGWAWMNEYGDPNKKEDFEVLYKYSPLHNIQEGVNYPPIIVNTGEYDDRVVPSHSYKMVASFQYSYKGINPIIIRIDDETGHGTGKSLHKWINEKADVLGFLLNHTR